MKLSVEEIEFLHESNLIEGESRGWALDDAAAAWTFVKGLQFVTMKDVLHAHKLLMANVHPGIAGKVRTVNVRVGWRIMPKPAVAKKDLFTWCEHLRRQKARGRDEDKEAVCKEMHVRFENIHPFEDGNGRIGRMFLNWQRLRFGLPLLIIKEEEKLKYYEWFRQDP